MDYKRCEDMLHELKTKPILDRIRKNISVWTLSCWLPS